MASAAHPAPVPAFLERERFGWPALASGVLDLLREAVLVLGRDARLLGSNRAARALLREGDGLALWRGGLIASTPPVTCELRRRVERTTYGESARLEAPRASRLPLALRLEPHPLEGGAAVLFACDPELCRAPSAAALGARYGLTPTESAVAHRVAAGARLEQIAGEFGIALETVRGHLKQIFAKTRTHRQAELVARLLSET
jgi:DNA-binding CsgD family transcriptional regulator